MKIYQIVAYDENGVIGKEGQIPWYNKEDLKRFRELTLGKPIIMGRKTADSIGKALPQRHNLVLSRDPSYTPPTGMVLCATLDEALAHCKGYYEVYVIGGAALYAETLPLTDMVRVTVIHEEVEGGDTKYPVDLEASGWKAIYTEPHDTHTFIDYAKKDA